MRACGDSTIIDAHLLPFGILETGALAPAFPLRRASRATSPSKGEELGSHCSPAGELLAKRGEGGGAPRPGRGGPDVCLQGGQTRLPGRYRHGHHAWMALAKAE